MLTSFLKKVYIDSDVSSKIFSLVYGMDFEELNSLNLFLYNIKSKFMEWNNKEFKRLN